MTTDLPTSSWRVKVYELCQEQWIDRGTGFCNGEVSNDDAFLVVHNETNAEDVLLQSRVCGDTQYQKQQGTLVVWTDQEQSEMALSFQEPEGCSVICDFLVYVQKNLQHGITVLSVNTDVSNSEGYEVTELIAGPTNPPPEPAIGSLSAVLEALSLAILSQEGREQTVLFIREDNYIQKLIDVLDMAEDLESIDDLHNLCRIVRLLFLMNDSSLYDLLLSDENVLGIVGMLEYDPEFPIHKANHREYLADETKFNEVIPINNAKIRAKIQQTFRLQFLKDVALARLLDESTCSMIASIIYYNQIDIISFMQTNKDFSERLFGLYDDTTPLSTNDNSPPANTTPTSTNNDHDMTPISPNATPKSNQDHPSDDEADEVQPDEIDETAEKAKADKADKADVNADHEDDQKTNQASSLESGPPVKKPKLDSPVESTAQLLRRKRDGVRFVHHLAAIVKGFQIHQRSVLYSSLISRGLLKLVRFALSDSGDSNTKLLGTELLVTLVEHDPSLMKNTEDDLGLKVLIDLFLKEDDIGLKTQAADTLKIQLDANFANNIGVLDVNVVDELDSGEAVESEETNGNQVADEPEANGNESVKTQGSLGLVRKNSLAKDDALLLRRASQYEERIYEKCMPVLFRPLIELAKEENTDYAKDISTGKIKLSTSERVVYEQLCEILSFCLDQHPNRSRTFVVENNLWIAVGKLLSWPYKYVQLAAVRGLRSGLEPIFSDYVTSLLESGILEEFLKLMIRIGNKNNLIQSSCLEMLETVDRRALKFNNDLERYENSWAGMLFYEWFNENADLFDQLEHFSVVVRLMHRYNLMQEEVYNRMQENQAADFDSHFILTSDDENHAGSNTDSGRSSIVDAAATAAAAGSVTFRDREVSPEKTLKRSSFGREDATLPSKQKRKLGDEQMHRGRINGLSERQEPLLSLRKDKHRGEENEERKGLRRTLATASKKLTLSFKGRRK